MNFDAVKQFMDHLTSWRIPGGSIAISIGGKVAFTYSAGYESVENRVKMTGGELFNIFSCTKPVTVCAALQLIEDGKISLDTPLYDIIPEYKYMYVKDSEGNVKKAKAPITLWHLFTMTAGFTYNRNTPVIEKARAKTNGKMNTTEVIRALADEPLAFEPGERWNYSLCHDVLGAVTEVVSGEKFRDYVKNNIFMPLDMNESYFHNEGVIDRVANMYRFEDKTEDDIVKLQAQDGCKDGRLINVGKSVDFIFGKEYDSGGAGITSSVGDYIKFATALSLGGIGANGERILKEKTVELLAQNQLSEAQRVNYTWPNLIGYGYGLGVRTMLNPALAYGICNAGEFGWCGAAGAMLLVDRQYELAMFYTQHMLNSQESYFMPRMRDALYRSIGKR